LKVRMTLNIGLSGCKREEVIEIQDEELEGLSGEDRQSVIDDYWNQWAWNFVDGGAEEL